MKNKQSGSSLVVALVMLTIITLVAVYSIEGSAIQSKMVASSLFATLTYQECRNEQEANIRFFNTNQGLNRESLLELTALPDDTIMGTNGSEGYVMTPLTMEGDNGAPQSQITFSWDYIREAPEARSGYNIDIEAQTVNYLFENECSSVFRFANNSQTLGAIVEGLSQSGIIK